MPEGTAMAPGTRFARISARTSFTVRFVSPAIRDEKLLIEMLHTRQIKPRFWSASIFVAAAIGLARLDALQKIFLLAGALVAGSWTLRSAPIA